MEEILTPLALFSLASVRCKRLTAVSLGSIPHLVMRTTKDYCRYVKALLASYFGSYYCRGGIDLM